MTLPEATHKRISRKVHDLIEINQPGLVERNLIRVIMDGGKEAVRMLLGSKIADQGQQIELPIPNLILSASDRLAYKLGKVPTLKVQAPDHINNERANKAADKRARIVQGWDNSNTPNLDMLYPQIGRWLPGYGFTSVVLKQSRIPNGDPFPRLELRDSYETYPGEWGTDQQPKDIAYVRVVRPETLANIFPEHRSFFMSISEGTPPYAPTNLWLPSSFATPGLGQQTGQPNWANQSGQGVSVYEYYNNEGVWWVLPDYNRVLLHIPNPLDSGPMFIAVKRFSFNKLIGQYNHCVGLLAAIARINLNLMIAIEDGVHAETNIYGEFSGKYKRGRAAVNKFAPGTKVERPRSPVPFEAFQEAQRLDDQLRVIANYPVQEDSVSPNSFVTGRGLEELRTSVSQQVQEYYLALKNFQKECDYKRLEFCDKLYKNRRLVIEGEMHGSPFTETFTPSVHINGRYRTQRVYGMMTGWDEPTKIITGLQLLSAEIIDPDTLRENLDGLENPHAVAEAIKSNRAEGMLMEQVAQMGAMGDPRAIEVVLEMMPEGDLKNRIREILVPPEEEQQQDPLAQQQGQLGQMGPGQPESTQTILERLTTQGQPFAGVQTVRS